MLCSPSNAQTYYLFRMELVFFLIFIYMFLISLCKDGTVTFWNPDSGKDIASIKIDYSIEDIKEENPEVVSLHCNPDLFFNNFRVPW